MKEIINQSLSDMLDKLLEKALEEKPKIKTIKSLTYDYFKVWKDEQDYEISIVNRKDKPESQGQIITYFYDLTDKQKELINKIFEKWGQQ